MRDMRKEASSDLPSFRVTLFVGPQPVEGKPFTFSTVFNVKKRSWKGGAQVVVELTQDQNEFGSAAIDFDSWLIRALAGTPSEERPFLEERAHELFIQALSWCKLELLLQSGIEQGNRSLEASAFSEEFRATVKQRAEFILDYVATELDLPPDSTASSKR